MNYRSDAERNRDRVARQMAYRMVRYPALRGVTVLYAPPTFTFVKYGAIIGRLDHDPASPPTKEALVGFMEDLAAIAGGLADPSVVVSGLTVGQIVVVGEKAWRAAPPGRSGADRFGVVTEMADDDPYITVRHYTGAQGRWAAANLWTLDTFRGLGIASACSTCLDSTFVGADTKNGRCPCVDRVDYTKSDADFAQRFRAKHG